MNLRKKKELAAKALNVGKNRICFNTENLAEIKEAITKQDIKDLYANGIINIKPIKGRKKIVKRKIKRGPGKIKRRVNKRKQIYVKITRKLRAYLSELKRKGAISKDLYYELRKKIRMKNFKSKAHLKEYLKNTGVDIEKNKLFSSAEKKISGKKENSSENEKSLKKKEVKSGKIKKAEEKKEIKSNKNKK